MGLPSLTIVQPQAKDRKVIKIAVSEDAKTVIERVAARYGMKEFVVASAIYEWFAEQDDLFQRAVLGMLQGLEIDAARKFMERWEQKAKSGRMAPPTATDRQLKTTELEGPAAPRSRK